MLELFSFRPPSIAKDGQKTLQELDQYRYVDAVKTFGADAPHQDMKLDDVKALVEWKL